MNKIVLIALVITSLTGTVKINNTKVKIGDIVSITDYIETALNASIEFDNSIKIGPMKKGFISDFIKKTDGNTIINGTVAKDNGPSKTTSTSSSRASDVKNDLDWDE